MLGGIGGGIAHIVGEDEPWLEARECDDGAGRSVVGGEGKYPGGTLTRCRCSPEGRLPRDSVWPSP